MENENTNRPMFENMKVAVDNEEPENPVVNWAKIMALIFSTFGLIVLMWVIRYFLFLFLATLFNI